jgi:hypothetical protein
MSERGRGIEEEREMATDELAKDAGLVGAHA